MDRLSALPDEVIFGVLSFLPPEMFVRTSVLAKAWRFHWSRVPLFIATTKMVDKVQVMSENINLFRVVGPGNDEFGSWIATVFASNARNLIISLNYHRALPQFLFSSETLLYLSIIDCCGDIPDVTKVYFPSLKKLELVNVRYFSSSNSLNHLLLGCPVLEELTIERMNGSSLLYLYSHTLTTLTIDIEWCYNVCFITSSLRYLRIRVHRSLMDRISACPLPFLVEADIDLIEVQGYDHPDSVINFVSKLHNVKHLTLSSRPINISTTCFFTLDHFKFHNLTDLTLHADWRFITCFLGYAYNLQVLTILSVDDLDYPDYFPDQYWMEPKQVPACLVSRLESVTLVDFGWSTQHEFDMAKYILKNAKVLKRMEIQCTQRWNVEREREAIQKFQMFEIESRTCELKLTF